MIDNYITILPCKFTDVTFDNGELPMFTSKKPLGLGKNNRESKIFKKI